MFGESIRLDVAMWILSQNRRRFTNTEIKQGIKGPVLQSLDNLCHLGLLSRERLDTGLNYLKLDHPLWRVYQTAREVLIQEDISPPTPEISFEQSLLELKARLANG